MNRSDTVLCAATRTAIGTYGGSLKEMPAPDLGRAVIMATLARAKIDGSAVETVVMGQVMQAGATMNPARQAPITNRVCGSGTQAIASAAQDVMLGFAERAIAGGMENIDQSPHLMAGGCWGYRMGDAQIYDSMLRDGFNDAFYDQHSGWVTEDLVSRFQISRDAQDGWALRSQQRFGAAQAAGKFDAEITALEILVRKGQTIFATGEHVRTTLETLAKNEARLPKGRHNHGREYAGAQ